MGPETGGMQAFYSAPAPMTALPFDTRGSWLGDLPADPARTGAVVRGVLIHRDWLPWLGLQLPDERIADQHRRSVRDIVEGVIALHDAPLVTPRTFPDRMVGVCRHFTTLHVALLRNAGVPARARAGFANYFDSTWIDHWITEWWDGSAWVRTDAQVGPELAKLIDLPFDPMALPAGAFLTGGEAWQRCRDGNEPPAAFGFADMRGWWFVVANLVKDLAALNKVELLPWDGWGSLERGPYWDPTASEAARVDALAQLVSDDDLDAIRDRYREPDVNVPHTITNHVEGRENALDPALLAV